MPLSVVQRYMGHVSPVMTSHYAKLREETIQEAFLTMAKRGADGTPSSGAAGDLYDLLQLDQRTDRILPNGWCMLPPRQVCEKGNACFTCDMFVTDRSHLPVIERQRAATGQLIEQRRRDFEARHGEPMSDNHVWLEPRLREARALDRLLAALQDDHGQAIRGAGVAARLGDESPVVLRPAPREQGMNGPEERTSRLREAAHRKTLEATRKASAAIDDLLASREAVTFRGVARRGNVSIDFVYRNAAIRARISELRGAERGTVDTEGRARDSTVVHALTLQLRKLREENRNLRRQVAVLHGELLGVRRAGAGSVDSTRSSTSS